MKSLLAVLGGVAVLVLGGFGLFYGGILGNKVQANYQKHVVTSQVQQHVRTAAFAQGAYEQFFNLCASVQDDESALDAQYSLLATATSADDKQRIETNVSGLISARADSINEYNADAAEYTRGQFLASNLPSRLDNSTYKEGVHTTCAS